MEPSDRTVIIGAGVGGLSAGYFLQQAGRRVEIYERAAVPGGRIQLLEKDGARIDVGAQYFHTNYTETYKLLDVLGLKDQLLPIRPPVQMIRNGRGYLVKHNTLRYRMIPLISNLKFARIFWTTYRNASRIDPYYNDPLEKFENVELSDYILRKCDGDALEFLVRPIITAFNLSDPEGESLAHFLRITKQFLTSSDACLPTGMFTFPEMLAKRLPVTYNADVKQIRTQSNQVTGVQAQVGGEMRTIETSTVILATPLKELIPLLPVLTDEEKSTIRDYKYSRCPLVAFFLNRRLAEDHWAYVFSRTERFKASFTSDAVFKCAAMVPSGKSVLQVWFAGEAGEELVNVAGDEIVGLAREEMERVIPRFATLIESVDVVRHHTGMSRYKVGIYPRLRAFLRSVSRVKGLHIVGDCYGHSTLETVVRSARRATDALLRPA